VSLTPFGSFSSAPAALAANVPRRLPELATLERVLPSLQGKARIEVEAVARWGEVSFPIYSISLGSEAPDAPCLALLGGVHGLERIGSEVTIAWLKTIAEMLTWDRTLEARLRATRICFMPIVNPVGMFLTRRANGNGVDLMRNAPVEAEEKALFLVGGHRYSNKLAWYRGPGTTEAEMEIEAKAVLSFVRREVFPARASVVVDVHSGFGALDRLWFPYAKTRRPPQHLPEISALKRLFDRSYPNHFYRIEPQAKQYTTHGDLWDYLYDEQRERHGRVFIPWTLELGSWLWLKKNPRQVFSSLGPFNPVQPHRLQRILRRHITLFDFLHRAVACYEAWSELSEESRRQLSAVATELWYERQQGA
jgi:hypothetical protein